MVTTRSTSLAAITSSIISYGMYLIEQRLDFNYHKGTINQSDVLNLPDK